MISEIPFTQFMLPNGSRKGIFFICDELTDEQRILAENLLRAGARFEIELLTTGEVHADCSMNNEEPLSIIICQNGPEVPAAIGKLIENAWKELNHE